MQKDCRFSTGLYVEVRNRLGWLAERVGAKPTIFDHSARTAETNLPIDPSGSSVRAGFDSDQGNCGGRNGVGVRALY